MEFFLLAVLGAVIHWIVERLLDKLAARWGRRKTPLTMDQVKRLHRYRFGVAVLTLAWCLGMLALIVGQAERINGPLDWAIIVGLIALTVYMARVTRRRWRRLRER